VLISTGSKQKRGRNPPQAPYCTRWYSVTRKLRGKGEGVLTLPLFLGDFSRRSFSARRVKVYCVRKKIKRSRFWTTFSSRAVKFVGMTQETIYEYIYAPVLNFAQTSLRYADISRDAVVATGSKFYGKDILYAAHCKLNDILRQLGDEYVMKDRRAGLQSDVFMGDLYDAIKNAENSANFTYRFTIWKIGEVPRIPQDVLTSLSIRVNECTEKIEGLIDQCKIYLPSGPTVWPPLPKPERLENPVVIANVPAESLESCAKQKEFIEKNGGKGHIRQITQRKGGLVAFLDTADSAQILADMLKENVRDVKVSYRKPKFLAVARFVPPATTEEEIIAANSEVTEVHRFGTSGTVKLVFKDSFARDQTIKRGIFVDYTHFRVEAYKELPKRCFNCQSFEHLSSACSNAPKCSKCAGAHVASRTSPCTSTTVKCALCPEGHNTHPSYSMRCPLVRNAMKKPTTTK